jgi:hypothetical protein
LKILAGDKHSSLSWWNTGGEENNFIALRLKRFLIGPKGEIRRN